MPAGIFRIGAAGNHVPPTFVFWGITLAMGRGKIFLFHPSWSKASTTPRVTVFEVCCPDGAGTSASALAEPNWDASRYFMTKLNAGEQPEGSAREVFHP